MGENFEDVRGNEEFMRLVDPGSDSAKAIIEAVRAFAKAYVPPPPLVPNFKNLPPKE
jgi:hypothetical protein